MSSAPESASRKDLLTVIGLLRQQVEAAEVRAAAAEKRAAAAEARCVLLEKQNAALVVANERLTARVSELERRLSRDSGNSSQPPSSDIFGRPESTSKPKATRRRQLQPGAPGPGLALVERPDRIRNHRPRSYGGCGERLASRASEGFSRRQVRDIPLVTVKVTEHRLHKAQGRKAKAGWRAVQLWDRGADLGWNAERDRWRILGRLRKTARDPEQRSRCPVSVPRSPSPVPSQSLKGSMPREHLGKLTQVIPFELVEAVLEETGRVQQRLRDLPSRVGAYYLLALVRARPSSARWRCTTRNSWC